METEEFDDVISDFTRFYILTILYEGPIHGYRLIKRFRKVLKKSVSPSLVYPFLHRLEAKSFVKYTIKPIGEKERKIYELTPKGRRLCQRLFKRFANLVSTAIEPSLNICAHCGCKLYEGGYKEMIDGKETMFCCVHCAKAYKAERKKSL
ncbi:MAG: helix-turn-helix transcriptional regulator [Candidatus Ranarchaeia archaeon]